MSTMAARRQSVDVTAPSQPLNIDGDAVRLTQAIGNLLTDASKFSPEGARIHVTAAQVDGQAQIRVRDEGAGIDPQILPRVFDLFVQGDQSLDRAQGGLGIGLTVTKRLVELHGGRIEVASAGTGLGSEFTIALPRGTRVERAADPPAAAPESRRILVVDDNADAATSLAVLPEMEGHQVITVRDAQSALRELDRFDAQLVLTDIGLLGIDGYALADLIRQRGRPTRRTSWRCQAMRPKPGTRRAGHCSTRISRSRWSSRGSPRCSRVCRRFSAARCRADRAHPAAAGDGPCASAFARTLPARSARPTIRRGRRNWSCIESRHP
jgi:hypothetical protein